MLEPAYSARSHTEEGAAATATGGARTTAPPFPATLDVTHDGDRAVVAIRGEIDLGSRQLLPALHEILTSSGTGIDLHLDTVGFCDCSGVTMLLELRTRALDQGRTLTVRSAGRAVERLLKLTGTAELFADPSPSALVSSVRGGALPGQARRRFAAATDGAH
ncbi:STAS domain-containing protein [Streptomyces sp. NPDC058766]|uniref:STAS domain-containing protein n=1 Tax=Streptomyces sp. NPDC058766 TaxID=3346630 RepID=UPI0036962806